MKTVILFALVAGLTLVSAQTGGLPAQTGADGNAQYATLYNAGQGSQGLPPAPLVKTYDECQTVMRMAKEYMYSAICPKFPKTA